MKVGIATLAHDNDNYGGTFQAIATQEWLRQHGHTPILLNTAPVGRVFWIRYFGELFNHPTRKIQENRRRNSFVRFWDRHYAFDPNGHRPFDAFVRAPTPCDAYLCGSDQIWGCAGGEDPAKRDFYFLNFGPREAIRIAYAASIGAGDFPEPAKPVVRDLLGRFDAVSLRETSGCEAARRLGREDAAWVCDPTLLHRRPFWDALADEAPSRWPGRLLLCYGYRWQTVVPEATARRALERGLGLSSVIPFSYRPLSNLTRTRAVNPAQWLDAVRSATCVLTNSFHCVVFALHFHRPFLVLPLVGRYARMNDRLVSLLDRVGLRDRIVENGDPTRIVSQAKAPIDWMAVEAGLEDWRKESEQFLLAAFERKVVCP